MTEEELRKLVQDKLKEANLSQYTTSCTNIICEAYNKGFNDGFEIATKNKAAMTTAIDNFELIKSLMTFDESDNLFMHLQIIRRGKDHPHLPAANKLIKSWLVRSKEHLDKIKDDVVFLCEHYKARAYISCVPKSLEKLNTLLMCKLAENIHNGSVISPQKMLNSACGELQGVEKRWVVDIDTLDETCLYKIRACIFDLQCYMTPIYLINTLNGWHSLTQPFNLQEFHKSFPDVEVKKNGLTVLYIPECICKNNNKTTDK